MRVDRDGAAVCAGAAIALAIAMLIGGPDAFRARRAHDCVREGCASSEVIILTSTTASATIH